MGREKRTSRSVRKSQSKHFPCNKCQRTFTRKEILYQHQLSHAITNMVIFKKKKKTAEVGRHKTHLCKKCEIYFSSEKAFQSHLETHGMVKPFECQICQKSFTSLKSGLKHLFLHIPRPFICGLCKRSFADETSLNRHFRSVHLKYKPFSCTLCDAHIGNKFELDSHMKKHGDDRRSLDDDDVNKDSRLPRSRFTRICKVCKKHFNSFQECQRHLLGHVEELPFSCEDCHYRFRNKKYLAKHFKNVHVLKTDVKSKKPRIESDAQSDNLPAKDDNASDDDDFDGLNDNKEFSPSEDSLDAPITVNDPENYHPSKEKVRKKRKRAALVKKSSQTKIEQRSTSKVFICEVCGRVCNSRFKLREHMFVHTGEQPYRCEVCDKRFKNSSNFSRHVLTHDSKKAYLCDLCGKSYTRVGALNMHMREHTGEPKPFACDQCPWSFAARRQLQKHVLLHSNPKKRRTPVRRSYGPRKKREPKYEILKDMSDKEKPYSCGVCYRAFSFYTNARRHYEIHSGVKKYQCDKCDKRFTLKITLTAHLLTHTNKEKNFACDVCQKAFLQSSYLRRHRRKEHPEFGPVETNRPQPLNNRPSHSNNRLQHINNRPQHSNNRPQHINNRPQFEVPNEQRCIPVQQNPVPMPYMDASIEAHQGMAWTMLHLQDQF